MAKVLSAAQKDELRRQGLLPALPISPKQSVGCENCGGRVLSAVQKAELREQEQGKNRFIDEVEIVKEAQSKVKVTPVKKRVAIKSSGKEETQ